MVQVLDVICKLRFQFFRFQVFQVPLMSRNYLFKLGTYITSVKSLEGTLLTTFQIIKNQFAENKNDTLIPNYFSPKKYIHGYLLVL